MKCAAARHTGRRAASREAQRLRRGIDSPGASGSLCSDQRPTQRRCEAAHDARARRMFAPAAYIGGPGLPGGPLPAGLPWARRSLPLRAMISRRRQRPRRPLLQLPVTIAAAAPGPCSPGAAFGRPRGACFGPAPSAPWYASGAIVCAAARPGLRPSARSPVFPALRCAPVFPGLRRAVFYPHSGPLRGASGGAAPGPAGWAALPPARCRGALPR